MQRPTHNDLGLKIYSQKNTYVPFLNLLIVRKHIADEIRNESKYSTGFTLARSDLTSKLVKELSWPL